MVPWLYNLPLMSTLAQILPFDEPETGGSGKRGRRGCVDESEGGIHAKL